MAPIVEREGERERVRERARVCVRVCVRDMGERAGEGERHREGARGGRRRSSVARAGWGWMGGELVLGWVELARKRGQD